MKRLSRFLYLFFFVTLLSASWSHAEKNVLDQRFDQDRSSIKVDHLFDEFLKSGLHPYRVTIRNGRAAPVTWTIRFDTNSSIYRYDSTHEITVEPGAEVIEELLVPSPPTDANPHYSGYRHVNIRVSAPLPDHSFTGSTSARVDGDWPSIVMTKALAENNLARLASLREKRGSGGSGGHDFFASTFKDLPNSWKGLTGVDLLMMDDTFWKSLAKQQKRAVMTWVRLGGRMELFTSEPEATFESFGFEKPDSQNYTSGNFKGIFSLGQVKINQWDGKTLSDNLVDRYESYPQAYNSYNDDFAKGWGLISRLGEKNFNPFLVFVLLIVFAILVGPVNLFHFAKAEQRHRLFITTPIISLIASLVIIFIILVQDGMGGTGRRIAFIDVLSDPEQRQLQILQHQISRTGVMMRSGFSNEETPVVTPVTIPESRWNPQKRGRPGNASYQFSNASYNGDWFRSRSEQGFHVRSARPTRSRIELRRAAEGETPPLLFSSMEFPLTEFHYIDANGVVWKSTTQINSGQEISLEKSDISSLKSWFNDKSAAFAEFDRERIRELRDHRQRYFALSPEPGKLLVETHPSIRWVDDVALVSGLTVAP